MLCTYRSGLEEAEIRISSTLLGRIVDARLACSERYRYWTMVEVLSRIA